MNTTYVAGAAVTALVCASAPATVIEFSEIGGVSSAAALSAFYSPVVFTNIGNHTTLGAGNNGADDWIVASNGLGVLQLDFSTPVSDLVIRWGTFTPITIRIFDVDGLLDTFTDPAAGGGLQWGIADFTGFSGITSVVAISSSFRAFTRIEFADSVAIPLPTSAGLGLAGLAALALRRRRED